ncbi:conserved hypothetical protein [Trichinella spiralis]|uniref:hypothetical protein n=1 Tax=Trichinella spiralis TaxID=6334 RepID=UPI0001EFC969|nr:conserved hypothetical protein [Trichinella spiralis]
MIRITLERKALNSNSTPKMQINWTFSFHILSTIEDHLLIFLVALMPFVDTDRIKLITHKWRTNANTEERDVHCRAIVIQWKNQQVMNCPQLQLSAKTRHGNC